MTSSPHETVPGQAVPAAVEPDVRGAPAAATPVAAPSDVANPSPRIYASLLNACDPFQAESPWDRFRDGNAFRGPRDPDVLLAELRRDFTLESLQTAGVVVTDAVHSTISLHPALLASDAMLIALRRGTTDAPYDVMFVDGTFSGRTPLVAALDDALAQRVGKSSSHPTVHAVPSMPDVAVLRSLGLCAAPQTGLAGLRRNALTEFFRKLGHAEGEDPEDDLPGDDESEGDDPEGDEVPRSHAARAESDDGSNFEWQLCLHNWSPAGLSACEDATEIDAIRSHFERVESILGRSCDFMGVCNFRDADFDDLRFILEMGTRKDVRLLIEDSLESTETRLVSHTHIGSAAAVFRTPLDYAVAATQAGELRRRYTDSTTLNRARQNTDETLERDLLGHAARGRAAGF